VLHDAADVASPERHGIAREEASVSVPDAKDLPTLLEAGSRDRPDGGVHAGGISSAGQHSDAIHAAADFGIAPLGCLAYLNSLNTMVTA
jgi:hypothetical protein